MKLLQKSLAIVGFATLGMLFINAFQDAPTDENFEKKIINDYNVYALQVPSYLDFAGEQVPLSNPDIYERMDKELLVNTYWQSNGLLMFKRARKYFPIIEPILAKNGIPDDFKYLAVIESGLTNAKSPAGASGFWQIMKTTGREYGLEVNKNVDERYNLVKATEVACTYLQKSKARLGSWTAAAAAYNAGNYGISKRLKAQDVNSYYDLLLGEETGRYVFRIIALKEILTYQVAVDTAVTNFAGFAKKFGINYKILKLHNPWLREPHLNNSSRKQYYIDIPNEGYYQSNP